MTVAASNFSSVIWSVGPGDLAPSSDLEWAAVAEGRGLGSLMHLASQTLGAAVP